MKLKSALMFGGMILSMWGCRPDDEGTDDDPIQVNNETCPVTGDPVNDKDMYVYKGRCYRLCGERCKQALDEEPGAYLTD